MYFYAMGYFPFTSNKQHKIKPEDIDFLGDSIGIENLRLLGKDGKIRIVRKGSKSYPFNQLIIMPWWKLFLLITASYVLIISFYAVIYYLSGEKAIHIPEDVLYKSRLLTCYFFSAETLTSVGYGHLYPRNSLASFVTSIEALTGWVSFAIIAGLVYGRFSLPKPGIIFSKHAMMGPYHDGMSLQCRLAGKYKGAIMEVEARMIATWIEDLPDGKKKRMYMQLPLEVPSVYMLSLSWTIIHKITEKSPLWGKTIEELLNQHTEIMLMITGQNELYMQTIHAHTSYTADEMIWNAQFLHSHEINEEGETVFHIDRIDDHQKL